MRVPIRQALLCATAAIGLLFAASSASANVTVTVYQDDPNSTDASIVPASTLPHATFSAPAIDFNVGCSDCTSTATFLNNPVFTNEQNGFDPSATADNIFLLINGEAYLNNGSNAFVVGHDDGVVVTFPALNGGSPVVNAPGPTGYNGTPFNVNNPGAAGLYSFTLQYAECCSGAANLDFTVNGAPPVSGTPEPDAWALMILGFGGVGALIRRRREEMAVSAA